MINPNETNKQNYNKIRNKYGRIIKTKKKLHTKIKLNQHRRNLKETWKIISNLLGKKKQQQNNRIANHVNSYFFSVTESLVKKVLKVSSPLLITLTS